MNARPRIRTGDRSTAVTVPQGGTLLNRGALPSSAVREVLNAPGAPLDAATRELVEPRFRRDFSDAPLHPAPAPATATLGAPEEEANRVANSIARGGTADIAGESAPRSWDFGRVRVHTDARAATSARAVNALAYTVGADIVFGEGQYAPHSASGRWLLAHELTHVVQQQQGANRGVIQRFESPEHVDMGDRNLDELFDYLQTDEGRTWGASHRIDVVSVVRQMAQDPVRRNKTIRVRGGFFRAGHEQQGLDLTPGEIIALMGDFYATWQDLQSAPRAEIDKLLETIRKERSGGIDASKEYETITKGRYTRLAKVNTKHFAPKNRDAWEDLHVQAIAKARQSVLLKDDNLLQEAYLMDAAGGHFLTDAFAAGHLFDSAKVQIAIQSHLKANPIRPENPEMQAVTSGLDAAGVASLLVLKNIHDRMNADGFEVRNSKGTEWKTYGDNHLKNANAEETRRIAAYAVFVSRQQITRAQQGESPDPREVLDLLPDADSVRRATDRACDHISQAVREVPALIHRNRGMLDTVQLPPYLLGPVLPFVGKSILGNIADPARPKVLEDYERRKALDPSTPYPSPLGLRVEF